MSGFISVDGWSPGLGQDAVTVPLTLLVEKWVVSASSCAKQGFLFSGPGLLPTPFLSDAYKPI